MPAPARGRITVVHFIGTLAIGGAEHQLTELITRLPPDRFEQHLLLFRAEGAFLERVRATGCDVRALVPPRRTRLRRLWRVVYAFGATARLFGHLVRIRPDVVHAQLDHANVVGVVAGRLTRVPVTITSQLSLNRDHSARTVRQRLVNRAHRSTSGVLANSEAVVGDLVEHSGLDADRIRLIYNGVDLDRFGPRTPDEQRSTRVRLGVSPEARVVACVANLHPYKGHVDLIRAFALLDPVARGLTLVLAGRDAGAGPDARAAATALGVAGCVRFVGQLRGAEDLLSIAELAVHPSHEEGFANAIIEAMSAGRAVVACDVGGNGEAIVDGTTGLLVPARDVDRLAAAMRSLLDEPARASAMGRAGRQRAEELYDVDRMVDDVAGWYDELVAAAGGGRRRGAEDPVGPDSYTRR